jgi:Glycosyl transferase family 2
LNRNMIKVGTISTVRAPIKQLLLFVNYHLNIGVDHVFLFFDDPPDEGIEAFSQYNKVWTATCSTDYWLAKNCRRPDSIEERQIVNVNEGVKVAKTYNCNWIIHIDSDELINPLKDMKQVLARTPADAVRFLIMEAISEKEIYDHIFMPKLFKKKSNACQLKAAQYLGCTNAIFDNEYFRGHLRSKMAIRVTPSILRYSIHNARKNNGNLVVENTRDIQLLHYDCVGIENWMSKWDWRLDGSGKSVYLRRNRIKQFLLYEQAKNKGQKELYLLYKKLHSIPIWERIVLCLLGLLTVVKINPDLFKY